LRALADAHRTARDCVADSELLVLRDDRPIAHALPGRPGRIVVSTAMLAALSPAERRALLAHERAHLSAHHHLFVAAVDVFAAANPVLRPLATTIRFTTERWADEAAARHVGDRSIAAHAVGKAALAGRDLLRPRIALAATTGPVPRRVAALLSDPARRPHPITLACMAVAFGLLTGSVFFALDAAIDLHRVLEIAQVITLAR
jgi:beta-lactamase regulating signal transducer with metallopeptidase domain